MNFCQQILAFNYELIRIAQVCRSMEKNGLRIGDAFYAKNAQEQEKQEYGGLRKKRLEPLIAKHIFMLQFEKAQPTHSVF